MNKKKRNRLIIISLIILVALLIVLAVVKGKGSAGVKVAVEEAAYRNLTETVAANGKIQPAVDVKISPLVSGEVVELHVKEGDKVTKGQVLAKIDPELYISAYEQVEAAMNQSKANESNARARLVQMKAQYNKSKLDFDRNEKLWKQGVISDAEFDAFRSNYEVAEAEIEASKESLKSAQFQVRSSEAALNEARENLDRTQIIAPNSGTVSKLSVEAGERVTGASQFSAGTEIMTIADLDLMEVIVEVNENDIVRVSMGDTTEIEVDAYLGRTFLGVVTEIATSANISGVSADQVTNFDVKIQMLKSSYQDLIREDQRLRSPFRPGMSATVEIRTEQADQVLTIPIQAVTTRADSSGRQKSAREEREEERSGNDASVDDELKEYVFVYSDGIAQMIAVETGIQDNTYIEIKMGLDSIVEVITAPYKAVSQTLKNGDEVKKVSKQMLFTDE